MMRWILICGGLLVSSVALGQPSLPQGVWLVSRPPDTLSGYYPAGEAVPYDGKQVAFAADSFVVFFSREGYPPFQEKEVVCLQPDYQWEEESEEVFYQIYDERRSGLLPTLGEPVWVLRVECTDQDAGAAFYPIDQHWLLMAYRGLFCYLTDQPVPAKKKRGWCPFRRKGRH